MAKEILSGIYEIKNLVNGKCYIGSSINSVHRFAEHKSALLRLSHCNIKLQRAWDKYGCDAFCFSVVEVVSNMQHLIPREQFWIDTAKPEYNICLIAGSQLGIKRSDETKKKMSDALKGRIPCAETRKAALVANTGKRQSAEHIAKRAQKLIGRKHSQESMNKMYASIRTRVWTEEQLTRRAEIAEMMSLFHKGKPLSEEHRAKIGAANTGKKRTEESKAKMRGKRDYRLGEKRSLLSIAKGIATRASNKRLIESFALA